MAQVKRAKQSVKTFIDSIKEYNEYVENEMANAKLSEVKLRLSRLIEQYNKFEVNQSLIEENDEDELESKVRIDVDKLYFVIRPALEDKIDDLKEKANLLPCRSRALEALTFIPKLPDLVLENFSGDIKRWKPFIESFDTHIHNNAKLNPLMKFQYLKNVVNGPAARLFENLDFVGNNYEIARALLAERYDKPKIIIEDHIHALFSATKLEKPNSQKLLDLLDEFNSHIRSLTTLGCPTQHWNDLLVYLIHSKFDSETKSKWRDESHASKTSTFDEISKFIRKYSSKLDSFRSDSHARQSKQNTPSSSSTSKPNKPNIHKSHRPQSSFAASKFFCIVCNVNGHSVMRCPEFLNSTVKERRQIIEKLKACTNCLRQSHLINQCSVSEVCRTCNAKHHTLLHLNTPDKTTPSSSSSVVTIKSSPNVLPVNSPSQSEPLALPSTFHPSTFTSSSKSPTFVLLATALIEVVDSYNTVFKIRALLDSGSQCNIITQSLASKLGIKSRKSTVTIRGITGSTTSSIASAMVSIRSRINNYVANIQCEILPHISDEQPCIRIDTTKWSIPSNLQLADPQFHTPHKIDMLIGSEYFFELLSIGQIRLGENLPVLQNTQFGWVISGSTLLQPAMNVNCNFTFSATEKLDNLLERFWSLENNDPSQSDFENDCEKSFVDNYSRDSSGRFIVRLPFHQSTDTLGESAFIAHRRFLNLERKLLKNPDLRLQYNSFMSEYLQLDHMELVESIEPKHFYLPHHCVLKPDSSSTKLRVVYDGSAKTNTGVALNEIMMVGPVIQNELFAILLRFRSHAYAISADIAKMYRQIRIHPNDQRFQYIFWRFNESDPIETYKLKTVTYGTTPASFLSTRCLLQLAYDNSNVFPDASNVIKNDFYIDDLLTGANSMDELRRIKSEVSSILDSAGMNLRKWCGNKPLLIEDILKADREEFLQIDDDQFIKTLGLYWQSQSDHFRINVNLSNSSHVTKRQIISEIAKIFDPIGLISPVVVIGKLLLQRLWELRIDWDESVPMSEYSSWLHFRDDLHALKQLYIPRHLFNHCSSPSRIQIHGFADASEKAYGAVVYVRYLSPDGFQTSLICSKSKIAPLKKKENNTLTLPRLELCAAQLLAQFVKKIENLLNFPTEKIVLWTDSMIVLHWLNSKASRWKQFVANRVDSIQSISDISAWHHVGSKHNPADFVSRGLQPSKILNQELWWSGPEFLRSANEFWSDRQCLSQVDGIPEQKIQSVIDSNLAAIPERNYILTKLEKYSNFLHMQNIVALMLRFISNVRLKKLLDNPYLVGRISSAEARKAENLILRLVQIECFPEIYSGLNSDDFVVRDKQLRHLSLFMGEDKLIRVGGRLKWSSLSYSSRHPILLPKSHYVTIMLVNFIHRCHMHVGPQGLLAAVRRRYWPLSGKSVAHQIYIKCVECSKFRPRMLNQRMGDLPASRVNQSMPFLYVGVDYCGPFYVHYKLRGKTATKAYLAVFVCFTTKAVHLEVASDLTSDAFMGVLKRFIATRGLPNKIVSDNGSNFIGANSELHELFGLLCSSKLNDEIAIIAQRDKIDWSMAHPGSPHFGGLYEAAVKSAKNHLLRITGKANLTYEELTTLVKQVEAILNSRPLTTISSDDPIDVLTPGHFIIGRPLTAIPEPATLDERPNLLTRWKLVKDLHKHFWRRWSSEYLHELQHRYMWDQAQPNIKLGTIVIIKDANLPPLQWKLGRIIELHPGLDGLIRVVSIQTSTHIIKRAITNVAPLPINLEPPVPGGENVYVQHAKNSDA